MSMSIKGRFAQGFGLLALGTLVSLGAAGCDGGSSDSVDRFVGTWMYSAGTETTKCADVVETDQLSGNLTLNKGIESALVVVFERCSVKLDVKGSTASLKPGPACTFVEQGVNVSINFQQYSFTVNGLLADESSSASLSATGPKGAVN